MAQIITSEDWGVNEEVTDVKLDAVISGATVTGQIISDQTALTGAGSDVAADYLLIYDADVATLKKMLLNQFPAVAGAQPNPTWSVLTEGATITWACDAAKVVQNARLSAVLGGNRTLDITGEVNGMTGVVIVTQDATGNRTLTLPSGSIIPGSPTPGTGPADLATVAFHSTACAWIYSGANFYWTFTKY